MQGNWVVDFICLLSSYTGSNWQIWSIYIPTLFSCSITGEKRRKRRKSRKRRKIVASSLVADCSLLRRKWSSWSSSQPELHSGTHINIDDLWQSMRALPNGERSLLFIAVEKLLAYKTNTAIISAFYRMKTASTLSSSDCWNSNLPLTTLLIPYDSSDGFFFDIPRPTIEISGVKTSQ